MPIRAEMKPLYPPPKEWAKIRAEILERARNCCEWEGCGVKNHDCIIRDLTGKIWTFDDFSNGRVPDNVEFEKEGEKEKEAIKIVLTIAHIDQDPTNNGTPGNRPNLKALCQLHHNRLDAPFRAAGRKERRNKNQGVLL